MKTTDKRILIWVEVLSCLILNRKMKKNENNAVKHTEDINIAVSK
jgi:hypothetical protein